MNKYFSIPEKCPICNITVAYDGAYIICGNPKCPAKEKGNLEKWIRVTEMMGVGDSFIEDVLSYGLVKDPADLYKLTVDDLLPLEGYSDIKAKNIIDTIESKRELLLPVFGAALNIANVSESKFEALVTAGYDSLDKLLCLNSLDEISKINGLGTKTAKLIIEGLAKKKGMIKKCLLRGIKIKQVKDGILSGLSFCFTGPLGIKRGDAQNLVVSEGGIIKNTVVKNLSYLVKANPHSQSNKSKKAIKYGTKVISEDEFLKMVNFSLDKLRSISDS